MTDHEVFGIRRVSFAADCHRKDYRFLSAPSAFSAGQPRRECVCAGHVTLLLVRPYMGIVDETTALQMDRRHVEYRASQVRQRYAVPPTVSDKIHWDTGMV